MKSQVLPLVGWLCYSKSIDREWKSKLLHRVQVKNMFSGRNVRWTFFLLSDLPADKLHELKTEMFWKMSLRIYLQRTEATQDKVRKEFFIGNSVSRSHWFYKQNINECSRLDSCCQLCPMLLGCTPKLSVMWHWSVHHWRVDQVQSMSPSQPLCNYASSE